MTVSIITVSYNRAATIVAAMESVLRQRRRNYQLEYIVVDGNSVDGTVDLIREFAARSQGVSFKWVSEPDRGIYDAMNKGIGMATGDIVGIVNADDVFDGDDVLQRIVDAFDGSHEAVYGDVRFVRDGRTVRYVSGRNFRKWMFRFAVFPPHPATFIRRECFERWGGYDISYRISGDFDLLLRFMRLKGMKARYVPVCTHAMAVGGVSTDLARHAEMEREDLRSLREHGIFSCRALMALRYPFKLLQLFRKQ